jgi:hypothetical protein
MLKTKIFFVLLLFAAFEGCSDLIVTEPDNSVNLADFNTTWMSVKSVYPYFEFKKINWDSIRDVYLPFAEAAKGDEIDNVLYNMLRELKDGHVNIQTRGGAWVSTYHPQRIRKDTYSYNPFIVRRYFDKELRLSGNQKVEYEILNGNIGYIYIATLRVEEPIIEGFDEALVYLKDTKGLIIDVRNNGGGSDINSLGIVNRLITSPIIGLSGYLPKFGLVQGDNIYPRGLFQYTNQVVMLINGVCFSSCEDFAEMMKKVPTVIAVGDTTAGASGVPKPFTLPSGRVINVSTVDVLRYDGFPIEWNGVLPDIRIPQTEEDIKQGRDKQLEYAISILRE